LLPFYSSACPESRLGATSAKARFLKDPLHGPKGPFFHQFFALKREEFKDVTWGESFIAKNDV
jgi:hypothetical protein